MGLELFIYLWTFFSGAITGVQVLFKPEWVVRTVRFVITGDRKWLE